MVPLMMAFETRAPTDSRAFIFDVDGVLLASPHERAWREALDGLADPDRFTTALYQAHVAGKPRLDGARAALSALGLPDVQGLAGAYADAKQHCLDRIIAAEGVTAFPDALRFVRVLAERGWPMAAASSSKNAERMMRMVPLREDRTLLDAFAARVCGRALRHGKPDPEIFLLAAAELGVEPARCFVAEDAPAGIRAARAGRMTAIGIARLGDAAGLWAAGADRVVASFDEIRIADLALDRPSGDAS
ncbi:HAD-superfamily hydrolase, subfamily IA, variant 3 [Methylobacterium sp. 4-46]|uniref:HAD family hydrolase n=1 Tax=unclassified Methylobacterium TaxID=2615210 RepID=UPI000152D297|nr:MULTISPECIES: HAD-IA family hydrolase [Methylobacterium]ACA17290.1 HAD-superfamily hydrolase, subfamily IA, variant 3 [Methylobacterium sp. 4-46]WFT82977.1 HAD-IA family hydrolase [Methylobacterium nodulans]